MKIHNVLKKYAFVLILPFPVLAGDFSALADNTARDLGGYNCTTSKGDISCRAITDYSGFSFDAHHYQMLMFGGGHSSTMRDDVDEFNLTTLTWKSTTATPNTSTLCDDMWASGDAANFDKKNGSWINTGHPTARHTYDLRAITKDGSELVILRGGDSPGNQCVRGAAHGGPIAHYNINAKTWRFTVSPPWTPYSASEVDPVTGKIIVFDYETGIWAYDPATGAAPKRVLSFTNGAFGYAKNLVYFPPNDKFYFFGSNGRVWEVALERNDNAINSALIQETGNGTGPLLPETGFAYDAKNRVIGGGVYNNHFHTFDPMSQVWAVRAIQVEGGGTVGTQSFHALDYDPASNVFIFISDSPTGRRTWAYRLSKGELPTDILAPSVPTTLAASVISRSQVNLSWDASSDNVNVVGYKVFRNGTQIKLTSATSFSDTDLVALTTYTYAVSAFDLVGNTSALAGEVRATAGTVVNAPAVLLSSSFASVATNDAVTLTWSSTNAASCTGADSWSGDKALSGSEKISNISSTSTFVLRCIGVGGSAVAATTVLVASIPPNNIQSPTLLVTFNAPEAAVSGGSMGILEGFLMLLGGSWVARNRRSRQGLA